MRGRGAGNRVIKAGGGTPPSPTSTHTPQPTTPSALQEKAWIRKDGGEQRAFGRRRCYLIVCVIGGAAVGRMLWSCSPCLPTPNPLPAVSAHARALLFTYFSLFFFHPIFSPPPFLSSTCPSFLLYFLRRKASLSVFTADLDLNVHTIKARGECQEWGWLSTVGPRGPAGKEPQSRGALRRAQRRGFGREGSRAPAGWANPEPEPLGRGGVQLVTDMGLERQTDSGREADSVTETDLCKHRCDGGGGGVPVSALRSASVCIFFSGLGAHCMWVDTFRGCVFVLGLAFGSPFKKNNLASRRLAVCARAWTTDILCSP